MGSNDSHDARAETLAFIDFIKTEIRGCQIKFKDDPDISWLHRAAHGIGRLVARDYDHRYTTVIYPHIYLPAGARPVFEAQPERYYGTLRHEFVHLEDFKRFHILFAVSYAVILPAIWTFRGYWEARGYTQNLLTTYERHGAIPDREVERIATLFASRDYLYMMAPRRRALRTFLRIREEILAGKIRGVYPYAKLRGAPEVRDP